MLTNYVTWIDSLNLHPGLDILLMFAPALGIIAGLSIGLAIAANHHR